MTERERTNYSIRIETDGEVEVWDIVAVEKKVRLDLANGFWVKFALFRELNNVLLLFNRELAHKDIVLGFVKPGREFVGAGRLCTLLPKFTKWDSGSCITDLRIRKDRPVGEQEAEAVLKQIQEVANKFVEM